MTNVKKIVCSCGVAPYRVSAEVKVVGSDLLVVLYGGDTPHIGAIAVALPRPSLKEKKRVSATSSVYNFLGHKDGVVAQKVSETLAAQLNRKVVVVAGIHVERIRQEGIKRVLTLCDTITQKILQRVK